MSGNSFFASLALITLAEIPQAVAKLARRCNSASLCLVVATSREPTCKKQGCPSRSSEHNFSTVYFAYSAKVLLAFV